MGFVCVLVLSEKNTLNEKLSVFVIYAAIRSLTNKYSNNLFLSLDMNGIVDARGIAWDYNTAARFWFRVLIIKLFLLLKVFLHRRQAGCPGMKCKQAKDKHCRVNKQSPESQQECQHYLGQNVRPAKYWVSPLYFARIYPLVNVDGVLVYQLFYAPLQSYAYF